MGLRGNRAWHYANHQVDHQNDPLINLSVKIIVYFASSLQHIKLEKNTYSQSVGIRYFLLYLEPNRLFHCVLIMFHHSNNLTVLFTRRLRSHVYHTRASLLPRQVKLLRHRF